MLERRSALKVLSASGLVALVGAACSDDPDRVATGATTTTGESPTSTEPPTSASSCAAIPEETAGPYPGDGSNGPDVLSTDGVVREDIRASVGGATGVAEGIPLSIRLTLQDATAACTPLAGLAVYLWHCDREGRYSMYSDGVEDQNYLRGVQPSGDDGVVSFTSIFPACYSGRWPHLHLEVHRDVSSATSGATPIATSQVALPEDWCDRVYATDGYEQSVSNLRSLSLERDNVFGEDGAAHELGTVTGDLDGLTVSLVVPVDPAGSSSSSGGTGGPGGPRPGSTPDGAPPLP